MKLQSACIVLGAAMVLTAPAWAQSKAIPPAGISTNSAQTASTGTQTTMTGTGTQTGAEAQTNTTSTGAFQNLSPGGQRIAQSLFNSQHPPTGTQALSLDQIATMKGREGWGRVFKEMKAEGLVQAKNLGQVVSGHAQMTNMSASSSRGPISGSRQASTRTGSRTSTAMNRSGHGMRFASGTTHFMSGPAMHAGMAGGGFAGGGGFHGGGGGGGHGR